MKPKNNIHENGSDSRLKEQFGTSNPFEVPEGYFDSLKERSIDRIKEGKGRKLHLQSRFRTIAAAAAILVLATLAAVLYHTGNKNIEESLPDINMTDLYMYDLNNLTDLEEAYLMSFLDIDSIDIQNFMVPDTADINEDAIKDYLLAENHIEYLLLSKY